MFGRARWSSVAVAACYGKEAEDGKGPMSEARKPSFISEMSRYTRLVSSRQISSMKIFRVDEDCNEKRGEAMAVRVALRDHKMHG